MLRIPPKDGPTIYKIYHCEELCCCVSIHGALFQQYVPREKMWSNRLGVEVGCKFLRLSLRLALANFCLWEQIPSAYRRANGIYASRA